MKKEDIFPIGIGTWKIDYENFDNEINALLHSFNKGQNFLALYMLYNNGEVVKRMKSFIDKVDRNKLFICVNLEPTIEKIEDVEKQLDEYLNVLNIDYVDSVQLHSPEYSNIPLLDVYKEIQRLVNIGKVRYSGISNTTLEDLIKINSEVKIDFFEGLYNLECKVYEDIKVLDYCHKKNIKFICYQPLRRNRTAMKNYPVLIDLANKYNKTQNQIVLNWIIYEKNIMPLIKSTNIERINENIDSINFKMSREDYNILNEFRNSDMDRIQIDWNGHGGISIFQLPNQD